MKNMIVIKIVYCDTVMPQKRKLSHYQLRCDSSTEIYNSSVISRKLFLHICTSL